MSALHRISLPPARFLLVVLACALPLGLAGCGSQQACFFWTEAEGACPSQAEAIDFFGSSNCDSPIESVDSEPEYDGELCCYDVTETSGDVLCTPAGPDSKPVPPSSGSGTMPGCQTCSSIVGNAFKGIPADMPCATSSAIFEILLTCLCSGACQAACSDTICLGIPASSACFDCATDAAVGCGNDFSACVNDL